MQRNIQRRQLHGRRRSFTSDISRSGAFFILVHLGVGATIRFTPGFGSRAVRRDPVAALRGGWFDVIVNLDTRSFLITAEKLGRRRYFELLRERYQDITGPIAERPGEI